MGTMGSEAVARAQRCAEGAGAWVRRMEEALRGEKATAAVVFRTVEDVGWTRAALGELKALVRSLGVVARGTAASSTAAAPPTFLRVVRASGALGEVARVEPLGRVVARADMMVHDERANPRKRARGDADARARAPAARGGGFRASKARRTDAGHDAAAASGDFNLGGNPSSPARDDDAASTDSTRTAALARARDTATRLVGRLEVRLF